MTPENYLPASERTEKKFENGMQLSHDQQVILSHLSSDVIDVSEAIDHMKKHLVYGASCEIKAPQSEFQRQPRDLNQKQAELLHAALGKVTESVEFFEMISGHILNRGDLDETNLFEEIGDGLWYDAMALRIMDKSFEDAMQTNIDKLTARYPEKFTEEAAMNRDLDTEREILEDGHSANVREADPSTFSELVD